MWVSCTYGRKEREKQEREEDDIHVGGECGRAMSRGVRMAVCAGGVWAASARARSAE